MQVKKVILASDHAGVELKQHLIDYLTSRGITAINYGGNDPNEKDDYPDRAYYLARGIFNHEAEYGILLCGTGAGMGMAINRYDFIRGACVCCSEEARLSRAHNNANVLILGGRTMDASEAEKCVDLFLATPFDGGRHVVRVNKLERMSHDFEKKSTMIV
ncbi:MAG: RpiB/LacA/LacB family sugar-phosphate isomerase [Lactobacillales bacterium]|jgi:ribose 5-phosphate isomerase B|nr:RpiB/LacA/LacB family sugar-phosphate isomerase [Lactobacillales bacterium]